MTVPSWWQKPRRIAVVVDNPSWIVPWAKDVVEELSALGDHARFYPDYDSLPSGDIAFFLGCTGLAPEEILSRHRRNLVVHESDLPKGRGFAPLSWQILEGRNAIPICLLEASDGEPDSGPVIYREELRFQGKELLPELREAQGEATKRLCLRFLSEARPPEGTPQVGTPGYFRRRSPQDSKLDPKRGIEAQFNHLRIVDNDRYPAFVDIAGCRYRIRIDKQDAESTHPRLREISARDTASYVVATVKPWNLQAFENYAPQLPGHWHLIDRPEKLTIERLRSLAPRYLFFPHWSWQVPGEITEAYECVCFHMTDVPYGRGGSPLQNLIARGHKETAITAMRMVDELDAGPVYLKRPMALWGNAQSIYERLSILVYEMIADIIEKEPMPVPQSGQVTHFPRRHPEQSVLPQRSSVSELYDHIRMLDAETYPRAFIEYGGFRLELSNAEIVDGTVRATASIRPLAAETKK